MSDWAIGALDIHAPKNMVNIVRALVNILSLRGVRARDAGPRRLEANARSGRRPAVAMYVDPEETHMTRAGVVRIPSSSSYFVYLTQPLRVKANGTLRVPGMEGILRGALCVFDVSTVNLSLHPEGCTSRLLPLPLTAPLPAATGHGADIDIVFVGSPDAKQCRVLEALEKRWRVRRLGRAYGAELASWLGRARAIVLPLAEGQRSMSASVISESVLTRAHIIAEQPPDGRPALYDERNTFVPGGSGVCEEFCTAVTATMLGKKRTRSRDEVGRLERALYEASRHSLRGLGRPGPSPDFLGSVIQWIGSDSMAEALQHLSTTPDVWKALETRTLVQLMRGVPSIELADTEHLEVACLCTGDAEGTIAGLLATMAAFPQYTHSVYCSTEARDAIEVELQAWSLAQVGLVSDPDWGHTPDWPTIVRSLDFWKIQKAEFVLVLSDSLLIKTADLTAFSEHDLIAPSVGRDSLLMMARRTSMLTFLAHPEPSRGRRALDRATVSPEPLNEAPKEVCDQLVTALFPGSASIISPRGSSCPRLPGMRVAIVDSFGGPEDQSAGQWECSIVINFYLISGMEIDVYTSSSKDAWRTGLLQAWGSARELDGIRVHPRESFVSVSLGDYTAVLEVAARKEPTITRRVAQHQWLCCLDPGAGSTGWVDAAAFARSFDRVLVGSMGAYHRYVEASQGVVPEAAICVVPAPAYETSGNLGEAPKRDTRPVALLSGPAHAGTIIAAYRSHGGSSGLTILTIGEGDPAVVAEIQALLIPEDKITVVSAASPSDQRKYMREGALAILDPDPYEWAAGAGLPQWALVALDNGCTPVFSRECAQAMAIFVEGVHGAAFSSVDELASIFDQHERGGHVMMAEAVGELEGLVTMHTPSALRQALISTILGGRGTMDTGLIRSSPIDPPPLPPPAADARSQGPQERDSWPNRARPNRARPNRAQPPKAVASHARLGSTMFFS